MTRDNFLLKNKQLLTINFLMFAIVCLSSGIITFIAANWSSISTLGRFTLIQSVLVISSLTGFRLLFKKKRPPQSQTSIFSWANLGTSFLTVMAIGGLFALIGQTYQTGADAWQLFAVWAALSLPFALATNRPMLWFLWLAILNTCVFLMSDQIAWFENSAFFLSASINLLIYLIAVHLLKRNGWLTQLSLLVSFIFFYLSFLINDLFEMILPVLLMMVGLLALKFNSHMRNEPLSFIQLTFFVLVILITKIIFALPSSIDFTMLFFYLTLMLIISNALFFSYLRMVYNNWLKNKIVITERQRQHARKLSRIVLSLLGWLIGGSALITIISFLYFISPHFLSVSIPIVLGTIIYAQKKILSNSIVNQISLFITFITLTQIFVNNLISLFNYDWNDSAWFLMQFFSLIIVSMYYILIPVKISRILSGLTLIIQGVLTLLGLLMLLLKNETLYFQLVAYSIIIVSYISLILLILSHSPKNALKFLRHIPTEIWWISLFLGLFFATSLTHEKVLTEIIYFEFESKLIFFTPMPLLTTLLLINIQKLPKDSILVIVMAVISLACYALYAFHPILPIFISLFLVSLVFSSKLALSFNWLFIVMGLIFNYYNLEISLIEKSKHLILVSLCLFIISMIIYIMLNHMAKKHPEFFNDHTDNISLNDNENRQENEEVTTTQFDSFILRFFQYTLKQKPYPIILMSLGLLLPLIIANTTIVKNEDILEKGEIVRLEIAPKDPRSLMQGDYMILRYQIENELFQDYVLDIAEDSSHRWINLKLNNNRVATLDSFGERSDNLAIKSTYQYNRMKLKLPHSYFFDELKANHYDQAKYAEFRVDSHGKYILANLLDADLKVIGKN